MKVAKVYKYFGTWCGPCKVYAPVFDKVVNQMALSSIEFIDVDVDLPENAELVIQHKIRGVPATVKVYDSGEFEAKVGLINEFQLREFVSN
jgi:thiol-disulfide isomerase/thioredoxin